MDALVTDAQLRNAVAGLRGLGRAGLRVAAVAPARTAPGLLSRFASERITAPDVLADPAGFRAAVEREAAGRVVYPVREESIDALLDSEATLAYANRDSLAAVRDKRRLAELAAETGLRTPATIAEATTAELLGADLSLPCVVKPAHPRQGTLPSAQVAATRDELRELLAGLPAEELLLVQERARGPLVAVVVVVGRDGELAARFQQVALRTWPPDAGDSSLATSMAPDERLASRAAGLLRAAGYVGLAQLQFVETPEGHSLIDINPRFYGSLPLALAAGVNLPAIWHAVVTGEETPGPAPYKVGVSYRWWTGELMTARRVSWRVLLKRAPKPRIGSVWAADDPLPGFAFAAAEIAALGRRRARR